MNRGVLPGLVRPKLWTPSFDDPDHPLWRQGTDQWDYEFNSPVETTNLPPGWNWLNSHATNAGYVEKFGAGTLWTAQLAGDNVRFIGHPFPISAVGPWTLTAKVNWSQITTSAPRFGFAFSDGSGFTGIYYIAGATYYIRNYSNSTTWASNGSSASSPNSVAWGGQMPYFRLSYASATNVTFQMSPNGVYWNTVLSGVAMNYLTTPTQIGIMMNSQNSAGMMTLEWWRIRLGTNAP